MVNLYQLLQTIAYRQTEADDVKHVLEACILASGNAQKIDAINQAAISEHAKAGLEAISTAISHLAAVNNKINDAWAVFRKKYPIIPAQYFVFDENGEVHETDKATYDKIPKPIEDYHVDVRDYDNYDDIPGADIFPRRK